MKWSKILILIFLLCSSIAHAEIVDCEVGAEGVFRVTYEVGIAADKRIIETDVKLHELEKGEKYLFKIDMKEGDCISVVVERIGEIWEGKFVELWCECVLKKKKKEGEVYCPFMTLRYGVPFLFFGFFGFGHITPKEQPCLMTKCALWDLEHKVCGFRLIGR